MSDTSEIETFLRQHLDGIYRSDLDSYHRSTVEDLTLYEWYVTPHRIDGIPFHDFMMTESARTGTIFSSDSEPGEGETAFRFDLANLKIQRYGETAIASYTLLTTTSSPDGIKVASHNESRVMVRFGESWKIVHVHKSPSWQAPHMPPS
jgi:hypothetical protein